MPSVYEKRPLLESAIQSVAELIGEPDWWADLRDRVIMAGTHECPLARLVTLGPKARGECPREPPRIVNEPQSVTRLRNQWERELTAEDMPPGAPWPGPRPAADKPKELRAWQRALYASFTR